MRSDGFRISSSPSVTQITLASMRKIALRGQIRRNLSEHSVPAVTMGTAIAKYLNQLR